MKGTFPASPPEELYDLEADPLEQKNLVGEARYADVLEELRGELDEMMRRTDSPLLAGHVSPGLSRMRNEPTK